jgi:hypothetical protein
MARRRKPPPNAELLTPDQERAIREALKAGATQGEAAAIAGISRRRLGTRLADQLSDLRVGRGRRERNRRTRWQDADDPDPATIAARAAEIRSRWTEEEANQRRLNFTAPIDLS